MTTGQKISCLLHYINIREYRRSIEKGQSGETGNIEYTRRRQAKQKHNTIRLLE